MGVTPVQEPAVNIVDAAATAPLVFTSNVTAGNDVLIGGLRYDGSGTDTAFVLANCSKTAGTATIGTITLVKQEHVALGNPVQCAIWRVPITGTGSLTISIAGSAGSYMVIGGGEYAGLGSLTGTPVSATATTATSPATTSAIAIAGDGFYFAALAADISDVNLNPVAGNSFTNIAASVDGTSHQTGAVARRVVTGGANVGASWALNTSALHGWAVALASFDAAGGGGGGSFRRPAIRLVGGRQRHRAKSRPRARVMLLASLLPAPSTSTLTPAAASSSWVVPAATLSVGPVTLTPSAASSTWVAKSPALSGALTLAPAAATSTWTANTATLSAGALALAPSAATRAWVIGAASLSVGPVSLAATAATNAWTAPAPTLSVGGVSLSATAATSAWQVNAPSFGAGLTLSPSAAASSWTVPVATLVASPLSLNAIAASSTWTTRAPSFNAAALALTPTAAVRSWAVPTATFSGAAPIVHLDEPLSINFTSLARAIDFDSYAKAIGFLDGGTLVFKLTITKGEIEPIEMVLQGADPDTGVLEPYDVSAATLTITIGKPGKTPIMNAKALAKVSGGIDGRVAFTPAPGDTDTGGNYDALVVATFSGGVVRKFPGDFTIVDAIA